MIVELPKENQEKLFSCFNQVVNGQYGMVQEHSGPGIAHHFFYPFSHIRFIAVGGALGTGRFILFIGTSLQSVPCINQQFFTFRAEAIPHFMVLSAEEPYHCLQDLFLFSHDFLCHRKKCK